MAGSEQQTLSSSAGMSVLRKHLGREVVRLRRVWFTHGGAILGSEGPLEITFDDGATLVLDAGADGEALEITTSPWEDPFAEPSPSQNESWVDDHGKWSAYDVSQDGSYQSFVGSRLIFVSAMRTRRGATCGVRLAFDRGVIDFVVSGDDAYVFLSAQTSSQLAAMNVDQVEKADGELG
jgi:hypothetical protein